MFKWANFQGSHFSVHHKGHIAQSQQQTSKPNENPNGCQCLHKKMSCHAPPDPFSSIRKVVAKVWSSMDRFNFLTNRLFYRNSKTTTPVLAQIDLLRLISPPQLMTSLIRSLTKTEHAHLRGGEISPLPLHSPLPAL